MVMQRDEAMRGERDQLRDERDRLANLLALQSRGSPSSDDEDDFGDIIVRKDYSPTLAADENAAPSPPIDGATLARVASRPSLVPRRPLEERKSMCVARPIERADPAGPRCASGSRCPV